MTSQQLFAAIDGFISAFMNFARSILGPVAILIAFFAAIKGIVFLLPFLSQFVPSMLNKAVGTELIATGILCALASK